jgi:hypothetical protein
MKSGNHSTRGNIVFYLIHVLNLMVVLKGVECAGIDRDGDGRGPTFYSCHLIYLIGGMNWNERAFSIYVDVRCLVLFIVVGVISE